jgi:uncharacterized protein (DUF2237 family)
MNVRGKPLTICSTKPLTGYNRTGYCSYDPTDPGTHLVCATVTNDFLRFTKSKGNDLITPRNSFPGLKAGDKWCLCTYRWLQAYKAAMAPDVDLDATHVQALQVIPKKALFEKRHP